MKLAVLLVVATAVLVAQAVGDQEGVKELAGDKQIYFEGTGGDDTHPAFGGDDSDNEADQGTNIKEGPGYWKRLPNFPGPKYGLPGYKESHDWETDFDMMSPLVFDHRFYRAMIKQAPSAAAKLTEEDLKTEFLDQAMKSTQGECPVGSIWFDANYFYTYYEDVNELKMGGKECKMIFKYYLQTFVFDPPSYSMGSVAKHYMSPSDDTFFPSIGSKIFNMQNERAIEPHAITEQTIHIGQGQYVSPPLNLEWRKDNQFSAARHMTLAFWMLVAPQSKAPNAELMAYGAEMKDNYFRTGFGCIDKDIGSSNCYFIFVFTANTDFFFHTYEPSNFETLQSAFGGNSWAHVVMMLTTVEPGHPGDTVNGDDESCKNNKATGDVCNAVLQLWLDKNEVKIVDWEHGLDTTKAGGTGDYLGKGWDEKVNNVWGANIKNPGSDEQMNRRWWMTVPLGCEDAGFTKLSCGGVPFNGMKFGFPWMGAYLNGIYVCDFMQIPSGNGAFGVGDRRILAVDAFWETMQETRPLACHIEDMSQAGPVTNDADNDEEAEEEEKR